ncbi:MAG TPA: GNAT family N-acetyltransferase [Pirellulaceae bacterium]
MPALQVAGSGLREVDFGGGRAILLTLNRQRPRLRNRDPGVAGERRPAYRTPATHAGDVVMARRYFKRYRMDVELSQVPRYTSPPEEYDFLPWREDLLESHAAVKYQSFLDELDARVFACLSDYEGCRRLMRDISASDEFLPGATWLAVHYGWNGPEFCGTIQGVRGGLGYGNIQNIGILPAHRGRGLATGLLLRALEGFREFGLYFGSLEVTVQNVKALRLYRRLGFRHAKTVYKAAEVAVG